jgi:arabinogalactan endo-1,4-beta-galactosidase
MKAIQFWKIIVILFLLSSCGSEKKKIYLGADLSYVNEIEGCGAIYRLNGKPIDPFLLFSKNGANIVRVRLWHTPEWTIFSGFKDVEKTIRRAKENKMEVLLDFHYSDTWADPQHQVIPKAWQHIHSLTVLGDSVFQYTYNTLIALSKAGLLPEFVQVGNETNIEILQQADGMVVDSINWPRNVFLRNRGIEAVKEVTKTTGKNINIIIHIA